MSPSQDASVFFDPELTVAGVMPTGNDTPPCWFVYWQGGAVPGLENCEYFNENTYGKSQATYNPIWWDTALVWVGQRAGRVHYPNGLLINGVQYGGAAGIDCCAEVVKHEQHHNTLLIEIQSGAADADPTTANTQAIGDFLPDNREAALGCNTALEDTYNLAAIKSPVYDEYGDGEYAAIVFGHGALGVPSKDWSKGGKQW